MKHLGSYVEMPEATDPAAGIEAVWTSVAQAATSYRVLPDGRCDIILRFRADLRPIRDLTVVVTAPATRHSDIPLHADMGFAGIRLRPGFFRCILGIGPGDLRGNALVGEAALRACPPLARLCAEAASPDILPQRLIDFVRSRRAIGAALPAAQTLRILGAFHASSGRLPVQDIARMHGLTARSIQRIVQEATGLSPKSYARILQFHRALRLMRDHGLRSADAAYEAGYADQSHMTHALRQFGGAVPGRLTGVTLVTLQA